MNKKTPPANPKPEISVTLTDENLGPDLWQAQKCDKVMPV